MNQPRLSFHLLSQKCPNFDPSEENADTVSHFWLTILVKQPHNVAGDGPNLLPWEKRLWNGWTLRKRKVRIQIFAAGNFRFVILCCWCLLLQKLLALESKTCRGRHVELQEMMTNNCNISKGAHRLLMYLVLILWPLVVLLKLTKNYNFHGYPNDLESSGFALPSIVHCQHRSCNLQGGELLSSWKL